MTIEDRPITARGIAIPAAMLAGLIVLELGLVVLFYDHLMHFECHAVAPRPLCRTFSLMVPRAILAGAMLAMFVTARPGWRAWLAGQVTLYPAPHRLALQIAGIGLILAPWLWLQDGGTGRDVFLAVPFWVAGLVIGGWATLRLIAPPAVWMEALARAGPILWCAVALALVGPELARGIEIVWDRWEPLTEATFRASEWVLSRSDLPIYSNPPLRYLGVSDFIVEVSSQCSGIEGFMLFGAFLGFYIWLFRDRLAFPAVWLLLPLGLALSWCFNVFRIAALILVGHYVSPDLAINGFHSHAGWLFFTLLAGLTALAAHRVPVFRRSGHVRPAPAPSPVPPFFKDPVAARLLPFVIFMLSALVASTFSQIPALLYPWRALAMALALALFWRVLVAMPWRITPSAVGAGAGIGVLWIVTAPVPEAGPLSAALQDLGAVALFLWVAARIVGTAVLVPVIEELFFRGYVMERIAGSDRGERMAAAPRLRLIAAIAVSTALFAALHDRWLVAGLAGLLFAVLRLRRGGLTDAIVAHAVANALIAAQALRTGDWALI